MKFLDDTTNRNASDAGNYVPGQNAQGSYGNDLYQDGQLDDSEGYQSNNPAQIPTNDSGYNLQNQQGLQDPEFQEQYQNKQKGGLAKQAGNAVGKAKSALQNKIPEKIGKSALGNAGAFSADTPENRERVKEEAKDRIRKYAKDKITDKFGEEVGSKIAKNVGKQVIKGVGKEVGEQAVKAGVKAGAKVGTEVGVKAAEGVIGTIGAASGPETLGLGWLATILLEIAIDLSIGDAIDCLFELKNGNLTKAKYHAERAYMSIGMFVWMVLAIGMTFSVVGWIIGIPLLVFITIYMIAGMVFPDKGWLQGLSRWWERGIIIFVDFIAFIIIMALVGGLFWWICQQSGLGTGFFANVATKVVDWWSGSNYVSTFNDVCTQLGKF